jgi:hypothetical protein
MEVEEKEYTFLPNYDDAVALLLKLLPKTTDTDLHVRDTVIKAHKILLTTYSPVFKAMLDGKFNNDKYEIDQDPVIFQKFINTLYLEPVPMAPLEQVKIVNLLDYYNITVFDTYFDKLLKNITNTDDLYAAWTFCKVEKLKSRFEKEILRKIQYVNGHAQEIIDTIQFADDMYYFLNILKPTSKAENITQWIDMWYNTHKSDSGRKKLLTLIDAKPNLFYKLIFG